MMHCTMDDLLALRAGEASIWARRHAEECASCRAELEALHQRVAQLKALPPLRPSRDRWPAVRALVTGERSQRRRRVWGIGAIAAAAALVGLLVGRGVFPSRAYAEEIAEAKSRSAALEADLREYQRAATAMSGREAAVVAALEDRIAEIDGALGGAAREEALLELWQQRVDLMQRLYGVRVTRATYVGL